MVAAEGGAIDEGDAPLALDVGSAAFAVVGVRVGVAAEPEADGAGVAGEVGLEGLSVALAADEVEVRCPFRRASGEVAVVVATQPTPLVLAEALPGAGACGDGRR